MATSSYEDLWGESGEIASAGDSGESKPAAGLPAHSDGNSPTNMVDEDECCAPRLTKALGKGFEGDSWICPKCGCDWYAAYETEGVRHWSARPYMEVLKRR
jgi:hypothetical protein